jgi:disulfide bond formation protein DsbB
MYLTDTINFVFGVGTLAAQAGILILVFFLLTRTPAALGTFLHSRGVFIAWTFSLIAILGSLLYSEVVGFEPCKLCWIQRIFMYPQIVILGFALWGRHRGSHALIDSALVMSLIGFVVAIYHILLQWGFVPELPCSAVGYGVSCAQNFVLQFNFITLPLMSATTFLFIALALLSSRRRSSAI